MLSGGNPMASSSQQTSPMASPTASSMASSSQQTSPMASPTASSMASPFYVPGASGDAELDLGPMANMGAPGGMTHDDFMKLSFAEQDKIMAKEDAQMLAGDMTTVANRAKYAQADGSAGNKEMYMNILDGIKNQSPNEFAKLTGNETLAELEKIANPQYFNPDGSYMTADQYNQKFYPSSLKTGGRVGFEEGGTNFMKWLKANYGLEIKELDMDQYSKLSREYNNENPDPYETGRKKNAAGGIMNMPMGQPRVNQGGVTELDYRAKGGFVPVGIKEKADDVPAMLSKNEFVFTADAVRGAGNGSIEKGAQKMYDTMKNLERRVT